MAEYTVRLSKKLIINVEVEADSPREAIAEALRAKGDPMWGPVIVVSRMHVGPEVGKVWACIGSCFWCNKGLFDSDIHTMDKDGLVTCGHRSGECLNRSSNDPYA